MVFTAEGIVIEVKEDSSKAYSPITCTLPSAGIELQAKPEIMVLDYRSIKQPFAI